MLHGRTQLVTTAHSPFAVTPCYQQLDDAHTHRQNNLTPNAQLTGNRSTSPRASTPTPLFVLDAALRYSGFLLHNIPHHAVQGLLLAVDHLRFLSCQIKHLLTGRVERRKRCRAGERFVRVYPTANASRVCQVISHTYELSFSWHPILPHITPPPGKPHLNRTQAWTSSLRLRIPSLLFQTAAKAWSHSDINTDTHRHTDTPPWPMLSEF